MGTPLAVVDHCAEVSQLALEPSVGQVFTSASHSFAGQFDPARLPTLASVFSSGSVFEQQSAFSSRIQDRKAGRSSALRNQST